MSDVSAVWPHMITFLAVLWALWDANRAKPVWQQSKPVQEPPRLWYPERRISEAS